MRCTEFENHLRDNECIHDCVPVEMQNHIGECKDCRKYFQFVKALESRKNRLEKAPEGVLPAVRTRIIETSESLKKPAHIPFFTYLFKPAFAGILACMVIVSSYVFLTHKNIGHVENLSERFKLPEF